MFGQILRVFIDRIFGQILRVSIDRMFGYPENNLHLTEANQVISPAKIKA
jgi:hypothetical protein